MQEIKFVLGMFLVFIFLMVAVLAVLWGCALALHALISVRNDRMPQFLADTIENPVRLPLATIRVADSVLGALVGPNMSDKPSLIRGLVRWPSHWPFLRLALIYWVIGVSLAMYFLPSSPETSSGVEDAQIRAQNRALVLLSVHIWLWFSALIDSASFSFTRNRINEFRALAEDGHLNESFWVFCKDICVASLCLFLVLFISNHTYYLAVAAADSQAWVNYTSIALNPRTVIDGNFASPGQRPIPGILLTALTCYIPTALWLGSAMFAVLLMAVGEFCREFKKGWRESAHYLGMVGSYTFKDRANWIKCAGMFGTGLAGIAGGLDLMS